MCLYINYLEVPLTYTRLADPKHSMGLVGRGMCVCPRRNGVVDP